MKNKYKLHKNSCPILLLLISIFFLLQIKYYSRIPDDINAGKTFILKYGNLESGFVSGVNDIKVSTKRFAFNESKSHPCFIFQKGEMYKITDLVNFKF